MSDGGVQEVVEEHEGIWKEYIGTINQLCKGVAEADEAVDVCADVAV